MAEWELRTRGAVLGPFRPSQIERLIKAGRLRSNHLIRSVAETDWRRVSDVKQILNGGQVENVADLQETEIDEGIPTPESDVIGESDLEQDSSSESNESGEDLGSWECDVCGQMVLTPPNGLSLKCSGCGTPRLKPGEEPIDSRIDRARLMQKLDSAGGGASRIRWVVLPAALIVIPYLALAFSPLVFLGSGTLLIVVCLTASILSSPAGRRIRLISAIILFFVLELLLFVLWGLSTVVWREFFEKR